MVYCCAEKQLGQCHIASCLQGHATSSILATLGDYFDDFSRIIEQSWFKRCVCAHSQESHQFFAADMAPACGHFLSSASHAECLRQALLGRRISKQSCLLGLPWYMEHALHARSQGCRNKASIYRNFLVCHGTGSGLLGEDAVMMPSALRIEPQSKPN